MAVVRIPAEERVLTEVEAIRAHLAPVGIWYENWTAEGRCGAEASADEILAAYAPEIQELNARGGYVTADVIDVTPEVPGLQAMLDRLTRSTPMPKMKCASS
ncbi:MAG: Acireductone dioxygenase [Verrucomicrobiaceae bacterium]|nr:Acireductone dioxygenase [Verrucomicrobiaceae bacterium]